MRLVQTVPCSVSSVTQTSPGLCPRGGSVGKLRRKAMKCPYYRQIRSAGAAPLCVGTVAPFEPSDKDMEYCATDRHRWCPLYRNVGRELALAVQQEAARATG
jgi:hypothetical protein